MSDESRRLRIGVLGAGPIAQFAHFEACRKARNAELYAICDVAPDLLAQVAAEQSPRVTYRDYDEMLADPGVDALHYDLDLRWEPGPERLTGRAVLTFRAARTARASV